MNDEPKDTNNLDSLTDASNTVNNEVNTIDVPNAETEAEGVNPVTPKLQPELVQVEESTPNEEVEVLDIDLNKTKPTVVTEQVIDKETEKKQQSKSSFALVIIILLILVLAVIFIPQISKLF